MTNHRCISDINSMLDEALKIIARARLRKMNVDEALDSLWELIVNIEYELNVNGITSRGVVHDMKFTVLAN